MIYIKNFVFIYFMILGSFLMLSSSTWFISWVGLELNLLSFIPVMMSNKSVEDSECAIKYFLVQSIGSLVLLFGVILNSIALEGMSNFKPLESISILLMFMSLMLKVGLPPFHYWFPEVVLSLGWISNMFLLTWQKLGPFILMSYILETLDTYLTFFLVVLSMTIGGLGGLNQTSVKSIMAFSSINHMGWMISALFLSLNTWFVYYAIYSILSVCMMIVFSTYGVNYFSDLSNLTMSAYFKSLMFMNMLSLGGLPPFLGFFPKWMVLDLMGAQGLWLLMSLMVFITMISLYFYMRLVFIAMMTYSESIFLNYNFNSSVCLASEKAPVPMILVTVLNLLGLLYFVVT